MQTTNPFSRHPTFALERWCKPSNELVQWQHSLSRFVDQEIMPFASKWDEAERFPLDLYKKAGEIGLSGLGYPEQFGGLPCDGLTKIATIIELARAGLGGLNASLLSHTIMVGPLILAGSDELKSTVLPKLLSGQAIGSLAVTEASGGSDVAALKTRAVRCDGGWKINGSKCYITSGMRADYILVATRTGDQGASKGISLFLVDGNAQGLRRNELQKTGWWCSDTAELFFDDVIVPDSARVGAVDGGFG